MPVDSSIPQLPIRLTPPASTDAIHLSSDPDGVPADQRVSIDLLTQAVAASITAATPAPISDLQPGDGYYYVWTPRTGGSGSVVGQWVRVGLILQCPDNLLWYALVPRIADDAVSIVAEWQKVAWIAQNPDNSLYYKWTPVIGNDLVSINGLWLPSTDVTTAGVSIVNPDDSVAYTWTPRLGGDGVSIIGQWV